VGAFISARIFRAAFGTDRRDDIAKYVIAVEVPSHAEHSQHDADPGFQEFNRLADAFQPENPLVYGGQVLHAVYRHSALASAPGFHAAGGANLPPVPASSQMPGRNLSRPGQRNQDPVVKRSGWLPNATKV
jgi:hypothetical protein